MPAFPDPPDPLRGSVAQLRPAAERDIPEMLIAHQDDAELYRVIGLDRPPSGAELGRAMEVASVARADGTRVWLSITQLGSDECCGELDVREVDWDHRRATVAIWVAPGRRGQGLAADALRIGGGWLIETCALERLELIADPANEPLRRAASRGGWQEEGVLRSYLRERGRRVDVVMLSLVAADLPAQ